jgi:signal recognition particle subunit SRP54
MFELLSERLEAVFRKFGGKGKLGEKDIDDALRQVRLALLEADVNLKVVKSFIAEVRERSLTAEVLESLNPMQQVVKIVNQELIDILGGKEAKVLPAAHLPTVVMLVGLQGSGKTTTAAKLALHLRNSGQRPLLVAADTRRPAAIDQLVILGKQINIPIHSEDAEVPPPLICAHALEQAVGMAATWVVVDTAGRLQIDRDMMMELVEIKRKLHPSEVLLVADAMTGQEAVRVAEEFNSSVGLTGLILTKMDGDARGGAALSIKSATGVPIKFIGTGEKADALEPFYPERLASRILGMGDMLSLIEKTERAFDRERTKELQKKMETTTFDLEDFLEQLQQMKKMGPLSQIVDMIPGLSALSRRLPAEMDDTHLRKIEAIILSMTPEERRHPDIIGGSRRRRIARGSGTTPQEINQLLNQFRQMQKLVSQMKRGKMPQILSMFR